MNQELYDNILKELQKTIPLLDEFDLDCSDKILEELRYFKSIINLAISCFKVVDLNANKKNSFEDIQELLKELNDKINECDDLEENNILFDYVKRYEEILSKIKGLNSLGHNIETIKEVLNALNKNNSNEAIQNLNNNSEIYKTKIEELEDLINNNKEKSNNTLEIAKKLEKQIETINNENNNIDKYIEDFLKTNATINEQKTQINNLQKQHENDLNDFNQKLQKLKDFYVKVYGDEENDGLKKEFEETKQDLDKYNEQQKKEIDNLLHGATTYTMSKSFIEAKESVTKSIKFWHIITVAVLAVWAIFAFVKNTFFDSFKDGNLLAFISINLTYTIPCLLLAIYASKKASENRRLGQEYLHKETLATAYDSYKKQIENLVDNEEDKEKLLEGLLELSLRALEFNPATTLDNKNKHNHINNPFMSVFDKVFKKV
ncbi:coiled-coil domain-containing protein [Campylobacter canadensis]|uniref:Uncharacterized protein n=1 Tax=Campylobacter canadensis TaxID=449520 RepID=A0ABS7WUD1_9BACT|nr:hypothetical protein [Campylobacter canadensis]MBZ7987937.1 hypothetical protein [Campylobacter canadensis]MBZ7998536.1 hypothetical protein [Campylobacter canadensis]